MLVVRSAYGQWIRVEWFSMAISELCWGVLTRSRRTLAMPRPLIFSMRAALYERSMMRSVGTGPRSLILTRTQRWFRRFVTFTQTP